MTSEAKGSPSIAFSRPWAIQIEYDRQGKMQTSLPKTGPPSMCHLSLAQYAFKLFCPGDEVFSGRGVMISWMYTWQQQRGGQKAEGRRGRGAGGKRPTRKLVRDWMVRPRFGSSLSRTIGRFVTLLLLGSRTDFTFEAASNNHCSQNSRVENEE